MRPAHTVSVELAARLDDYIPKAIERKIERGDWTEGREYRRAPDGRLLVDIDGYERLVERP